MAAFKCNEAANDQLIRLFVSGSRRVKGGGMVFYESTGQNACSLSVFVKIQCLIIYIE